MGTVKELGLLKKFLALGVFSFFLSLCQSSLIYALPFNENLAARQKAAEQQTIALSSKVCWEIRSIGYRYKYFQKGEWTQQNRFGKDGLFWNDSDITKMHSFIDACLKDVKNKITTTPWSPNDKEYYQQQTDMFNHAKLIIDDIPKWISKETLRLEAIAEKIRAEVTRKKQAEEQAAQDHSQYIAFIASSIKFLEHVPVTDEGLNKVKELDQKERKMRRVTSLASVLDRIDFMRILSSVEKTLPFQVQYQKCLNNGVFADLGVDEDIINDKVLSFNSPQTATIGALVCSSFQKEVNLDYDGPGIFSNTITLTMDTPKGVFSIKLKEQSKGHWAAIEVSGTNGSAELTGKSVIIYTVSFPHLWKMAGG